MITAIRRCEPGKLALLAAISLPMLGVSVVADEAKVFRLTISAGGGLAPDYLGSNDYASSFGGSLSASYGLYFIEVSPESAKANISGIDGLRLGPVVRRRGGRSDVEDDAVDRLRDIDATLEVGGFIRIDLGVADISLEVTHDVADQHDGFVAELVTRLPVQVTEAMTLTSSIGAAWISDDFAETYFSIDADDADRSGLDRFDADGGLAALNAGLVARFQLSDRLFLDLQGRYARLLNAAADSPITDDRGSINQAFLRSGISYRF